jgi:hypothetical protein
MAGVQCHKRLYLETFQPELADLPDESVEATLAVGHAVGELARERFSGGVLIDWETDWSHAVHETRVATGSPANSAIFEGAFALRDVRIRTDILTKTRDRRFDLFEVKSTLDMKPEHEWDLALQYYVLVGIGIPIRGARLMHLNRDYVYPGGEYDLKRLFKFKNLTHLVKKRRPEIVTSLRQMRKTLRAQCPEISVGPQCRSPYRCKFYGHCHENEPDYSMNQLPRLSPGLREHLTARGIIKISEIPNDFEGLSELQARAVAAVKTATRFHDPAISRRLERLKFPIHFLDFESLAPALPVYPGTRPYQTIPFQWSDHVLKADGDVVHREFLHDDRTDPRRIFTEELLAALGAGGSILVYSSFEDSRLAELSEAFQDLASRLQCVRERIVDLLPLIREHIYDPGFRGSFSLKSVLPVLAPDPGYDGLAISNGALASLAYAEMQAPETSTERRLKIRSDLLTYCKRDTQALLELYRLLR